MTSGLRDGRPSASALLVPLLVAVAAVAGLLAACGSSGPDRAPTTAQVTEVLARHARALLARDEKAFLADVDRERPAAGFRSRQAAQFEALAQVPLQSWSYAVSAPVTEPSALAAARSRYGAPVVIVRLSLAYRLTGVDPAPSTHDLWWTFVRRGGRTVAAGDDDLAEAGGRSWRGPWDFGPLEVRRSASGLVLAHPGTTTRLVDLAVALDSAVPVVTRVWGHDWPGQVAIVVPGSRDELAELSGTNGAGIVDTTATTIADPPDPLSGVVTGRRVVMNPETLPDLTPQGLRIVVQHESTHVAAAGVTDPATPRWVVEGFADYVGNLDSGQPVRVAAPELTAEVRAGRLPAALPTDADFLGRSGRLAAFYEEAWLACRYLAARAGRDGLLRFYRAVAAPTTDPQAAVARALRTVLGTTPTGFVAAWRDHLRTELG